MYAKETGNDFYTRAVVISVINGIYNIEFDNGTIQEVTNVYDLLVYFPCNCGITIDDVYYSSGAYSNTTSLVDSSVCILSARELTNGQVL